MQAKPKFPNIPNDMEDKEYETFRRLAKWDFERLDEAYWADWNLGVSATQDMLYKYWDKVLEQAYWTKDEWIEACKKDLMKKHSSP